MARRRRTGRSMSVPDAQIAATALTQDLRLATRDFIDLDLIDPFGLPGQSAPRPLQKRISSERDRSAQ